MCKAKKNDKLIQDNPENTVDEMSEGDRNTELFSEDFRTALNSSSMPIYIIDPEKYEVVYCNDLMCKYLGRDVTGGHCYKEIRSKNAPCESCSAMRLYKDGDDTPKEFRHPLGIWVLLQASFLKWRDRNFIQITCVDITKQKAMENELRLRNREYAAVVRQSLTGVMRYDIATDKAAVNVNSNLDRVDEHIIENFSKEIFNNGMVTSASADIMHKLLDDIRSGVHSKGYDVQLNLKCNGLRWCHVDYILIEDEEQNSYRRAVISFYDNTEQREKEMAYHNWEARLNALMDEYTSYIEVNLSQNVVEAEGKAGSWNQSIINCHFNDFLEEAVSGGTFVEDIRKFWNFFDRERLIAMFYAGHMEERCEYRIVVDGEIQWYRAELQMVSDPSTDDIKAFITFSNVDEEVRAREHLTREAERDSMTGLYNHATAEKLIKKALNENVGERCCFLIIDMDDLRDVNSSLGHPEGDRALEGIANAMKAQFRRNDILGRIGGDEFVALLRDVPEASGLRSPISSFMRRVSEIDIGPLNDKSISVSIGGSIGTTGDIDFTTLYKQADLALYYTKAMGKNDYNFYVPEMEDREFIYRPHSTVTMTRADWFESLEFKKLLRAMAAFFPLVISVNLTQNTYYMMEYIAYTSHKAGDEGNFDQLIAEGASVFHPDDRQSFLDCFERENLLRAYAEGKTMVSHEGRQLGDDGQYHEVSTVVVFMEDEETGDICEITFAHVKSEELQLTG